MLIDQPRAYHCIIAWLVWLAGATSAGCVGFNARTTIELLFIITQYIIDGNHSMSKVGEQI